MHAASVLDRARYPGTCVICTASSMSISVYSSSAGVRSANVDRCGYPRENTTTRGCTRIPSSDQPLTDLCELRVAVASVRGGLEFRNRHARQATCRVAPMFSAGRHVDRSVHRYLQPAITL